MIDFINVKNNVFSFPFFFFSFKYSSWGHRFSHSSTLIWSGHIVHHSSEYFNFTTAFRQGVFERVFTSPRNLLLALMGFPPAYFLLFNQIDTIYMFFTHTETIDKLWWPIEMIFNTREIIFCFFNQHLQFNRSMGVCVLLHSFSSSSSSW